MNSPALFLPRFGATQPVARPTPATDASHPLLAVPIIACAPASATGARDTTLLTGATGFLGQHLLRELLLQPGRRVVCLVRAADAQSARARLDPVLETAAARAAGWPDRVDVIPARLHLPMLDLDATTWATLTQRVDRVLHAAAEVNWVKSYRQLRDPNVIATAEIIRFAQAARVRRLQFVSTLAVCFSEAAPARVTEAADPLDWVAGMPLAYARSKAVAEHLLRRAASEGLPVSIFRPGLLIGDSQHGRSNPDDMISALLASCVRTGCAPDVDWIFDCLPVDHVARAITRLDSRSPARLRVHHLRHERPRHWRELVLWMNLSGYPIRLCPLDEWLAVTFQRSPSDPTEPPLPLATFRRLFVGDAIDDSAGDAIARAISAGISGAVEGPPKAGARRPRPFEIYLGRHAAAISTRRTRWRLAQQDLREPPLDGPLLRRYFDHYRNSGVLPPPATAGDDTTPESPATMPPLALRQQVARRIADDLAASSALQVAVDWAAESRWQALPFDARDGLLAEMACARVRAPVGLRRYQVQHTTGRVVADLVVKRKPGDHRVIDAILSAARLLNPAAARALATAPDVLGLRDTHRRETRVMIEASGSMRRHMPRCLGVTGPAAGWPSDTDAPRDRERSAQREPIWSIAIETFVEGTGRWTADGGWQWSTADQHAAIDALVQLQADPVADTLAGALPDPLTDAAVLAVQPAWQALADLAAPVFTAQAGPELTALHQHLVDTLATWWPRQSRLPQTLIHHDFNPRNLVRFKQLSGEQTGRVVALDWELAMRGLPQRDLVELLAFTWPAEANADDWRSAVERHRDGLETARAMPIDQAGWREGLTLSLQRMLVQRLPLYAIADRFQRQPFLPMLLANWQRLHGWSRQG